MVWSPRLKDSVALLVALLAAAGGAFAGGAIGLAGVAVAAVLTGFVLKRARAETAHGHAAAKEIEAREREASVVAEAASTLLASPGTGASSLAPRLERVLAAAGARLELCHAPAPRSNEAALPLRMDGGTGWLYVDRDGPLTRDEAERLQDRLAHLIRTAQDRARVADAAVEAEAARRADLTRTSLMHAISGDLRAPLTAMTGAAAGLREPDLATEDRLQLAAVVCSETDRMERMVSDLLDLSRIEAGALNSRTEWVDLNDLVVQAVETVRSQRGEFPIRTDLPHDLPMVRGDVVQLHRVFSSLIDNAAKFSPPDEAVEVRGAFANGRVTIRVIDHGRGIPPGEQSQIFRPFVRGRDEEGSGLGLAICRGFVEANGGRITLQSRGKVGSAFAVSFPTTPQPAPVA